MEIQNYIEINVLPVKMPYPPIRRLKKAESCLTLTAEPGVNPPSDTEPIKIYDFPSIYELQPGKNDLPEDDPSEDE
jgi:hypothetical protein